MIAIFMHNPNSTNTNINSANGGIWRLFNYGEYRKSNGQRGPILEVNNKCSWFTLKELDEELKLAGFKRTKRNRVVRLK